MKQQHTLQPKLRFPEFEGDWVKSKLGNISKKPKYGLNSSATEYDGINGYLRITDIDENSNKFIKDKLTSPDSFSDEFLLKERDLIFTRTGASTGKSYLYSTEDGKLYFAGFLIKFSLKDNYNDKFVFYQTKLDRYSKWVKIMSMRSGQPGINSEEYSTFDIILPSLPEQQKIADYLSTVDNKINLLEEKKKHLSLYKKAMMQKLFAQEIRFKDENGNDFSEWESFQLKDILLEHKEKNKENKYTEVVSVAKQKGVINQIEHLGRSYSAENIEHYKVINPYDVVYTKSPTSGFPFGIIKQNKLNRSAVLSPLYAVFKPKTIYLGMLLHDLFLSEVETFNYLVPLVQKGAKNTMNINNEDFLNGKKYKLPTSEKEQQKIANFLSAIDESIEKVNEQITQTQSFKKAMLQQLFV